MEPLTNAGGSTLVILAACAVFLALVCAVALLVICSKLNALQAAVRKLDGGKLPALVNPDIRVEPLWTAETPAAAPAAPATRLVPGGEVELVDVTDDRTAAILMAIVADETKLPLEQLRFLSIREVKGG